MASIRLIALFIGLTTMAPQALALDLDWSGQFRSEAHYIHNYDFTNGSTSDTATNAAGGYTIPGGGSNDASFQTLFMRVRPKVIVNDNIYIKSEWWVGDPIYGFYGNSVPFSTDQREWYSTNSRGSTITAQRFWGEFVTDVGTIQIGRAPLNWGLGIVWNSGDDLWDRYQSTGDVIRMVSKFGSFSFTPSIIKYAMGNTIGGAANYTSATPAVYTPLEGNGSVADYSLMLKFENPDEDFEGGVNFIKRISGAAQDSFLRYGYVSTSAATPAVAGMNFNTWDIYGRKNFGKLTLAAEVPVVNGDLGSIPYTTFAAAVEATWKPNDTFDASLKFGHAPGQPSNSTDSPTDQFKAFYFNPDYKPALIMFNYQLANFAGPQTLNNINTGASSLASPYDNPIVNADYLSIGGGLRSEKWHFHAKFTFATAQEAASAASSNFYNTNQRKFFANNAGTDQSKSLGWEMDYGTSFFWDENFQFGLDFGWYFPGAYYQFSNVPGVLNTTNSVFATVVKAGVNF